MPPTRTEPATATVSSSPSPIRVSVVIPTIGRDSVAEAVRSARAQHGVETEILVVDADDDTEDGQDRAQLIGTQGREGHLEVFVDVAS